MTEILASEILAVSGDLGGNTDVAYRDLHGDYWEKRFSPGKTFHVTAVDPTVNAAERDVLTEERDAALLEIERLQGVVLDLQERCGWEQRRADDAEAAVREWELEADTRWRYVGGPGVTA